MARGENVAENPSASEPQDVVEVVPEKPVHDPSTIIVEHDPSDPNSPTYQAPDDANPNA